MQTKQTSSLKYGRVPYRSQMLGPIPPPLILTQLKVDLAYLAGRLP